jgi:hypothetical protein
MADDIDDKHNLNTHDKFIKAMRAAGKYENSPCLNCEGVCFREDMLNCLDWQQWKERIEKNG